VVAAAAAAAAVVVVVVVVTTLVFGYNFGCRFSLTILCSNSNV
jgi:hypothetical protein